MLSTNSDPRYGDTSCQSRQKRSTLPVRSLRCGTTVGHGCLHVLTVHRSTSGAVLARGLADLLRQPLGDPFAAELVAIPARGVERWLAQRLSHTLGAEHGDGVCANVEFPWPSTIVDEAVAAVSPQHATAVERWQPAQARWPLVEVIDAALTEPWARSLARHLHSRTPDPTGTPNPNRTGDAGTADKGRRLALATRLAVYFDEYGQSRPQLLRAWAAGRDEFGDGAPLPDDLEWQPELWRRLREQLDTPAPAELLEDACARLAADPAVVALPDRISVFGLTRLSPARLRVLAALAAHRDVHLWLHHPSPALWQAAETADRTDPILLRSDDPTRKALRNPLLASLSRDLLEFQHVLYRCAPGAVSVEHPGPALTDTLLDRLKHNLATDADPDAHTGTGSARPLLQPGDRSVQIHACHGRSRQVEVLREVVVGLLADDPALEPRDILVMCPDVETFAPLIASVFALEDGVHPAARLRIRVADRALQQTNELLDVLSQLLELGTARITAPQVLDLAGRPAVRERFGFDDDELERLRDWMVSAGIRWGLDGPHRSGWQLEGITQGTWHAGLDRLLLGVAVEGDVTGVGDVVGVDDVDSADIDLAGRFAEFVDRLGHAQELMSGRHTAHHWGHGLETAVLSVAATTSATSWQIAQLQAELADLVTAAGASSARFGLADLRAVMADLLAGRPTRSSFRTGTLTICTLVPMRSVPHRVICLIGLDDGSFPRQSSRDGDDVLAREPWVGERDPRSEDRQLFLDAIVAAQEHLVITYSGADDRTGASIPPAVPLGELLDALDRTASTADGLRVRDVVTVRHPLQPFDARNFTAAALGRPGPFSFDRLGLEGSLAAGRDRDRPPPFLLGPLPERPAADVDLGDLQKLLQHPARGFLRQRLAVATTRAEDEPDDALPVELDNLQLWDVGERLLHQRLAGLTPAQCKALEGRRGLLPPGPLGMAVLSTVGREVESIVTASADERSQPADAHDVDVLLPDRTRLTGTVGDVHGTVLLSLTYSKLAAKHRLTAWVNLVALTATDPFRRWSAVAVGRGRNGAVRSVFDPLPPGEADAALAELLALYRSGLQSPLPLPLKSAAAYAAQRARGSRVPAARAAAAKSWLDDRFPGEQSDDEHVLLYGHGAQLSVLTDQVPFPQEKGEGWAGDENDRFGLLAWRLWARLLAAERQEHR
jgi:exodeoxyribonuclease V gamma subunit